MKANRTPRKNLKNNDNAIFDVIIGAAFAVIFIIVALYIGTFVQGTVGGAANDALPTARYGTPGAFYNKTANTLLNLSGYWDTDTSMLNIALVIVIMTLPLMALVYVRKIM